MLALCMLASAHSEEPHFERSELDILDGGHHTDNLLGELRHYDW